MNTSDIPGLNLIPEPWRTRLVLVLALSPYVTRAYYAIVKGGGLKGVLSAIWLGTNTPKPLQPTQPAPPSNP